MRVKGKQKRSGMADKREKGKDKIKAQPEMEENNQC